MTIRALTSWQGWTWTQKAPPRGSCLTLSPGDDKEDEDDGDGDDGDGGDEDMMEPK